VRHADYATPGASAAIAAFAVILLITVEERFEPEYVRRVVWKVMILNMATAQASFDARPFVDALFTRAVEADASDIHLEPLGDYYDVRMRVDGLLQSVDRVPADVGRSMALRLMVMAELLTYKLDVPQEGRVRIELANRTALDVRLAVMQVARGLRAVVRMPAELIQPRTLDDLGLPTAALAGLKEFAAGDGGMLIVAGPAGSGKTTTIYALLEHIARTAPGLSIISIEDPIERVLTGVTQVEISSTGSGGRPDNAAALRSILRQDPQVLMLGEIRDAATASIAVQAALSGHRLVCTLHAGHPAGALARLLEMGVEPYQLTSSIWGVLAQRLLRRSDGGGGGGGYRGRVPVAELGRMDGEVRRAVLQRADADMLRKAFCQQAGYRDILSVAADLVKSGVTDSAELQRVFGITA